MIRPFLQQKGAYYFLIFKEWLFRYLITQLCITAVSLPFFVAWGIEVSLASFVGNLIFTPFITLFLLLSSLIFISGLCGYVPSFLIAGLNQLSILWVKALQLGSPTWLIKTPYGSSFLLLCYAFFLIYLGITRSWKTKITETKKLGYYALLFCCSFIAFNHLLHQNKAYYLENKLYVSPQKEGSLKLYDNGFFSSSGNPINQAAYKLKPYLIKQCRTSGITCYVSNRLSIKTCQGLAALLSFTSIKKIILPPLQKGLAKSFWRSYFALKEKAEKKGTSLLHSKYAHKMVSKHFGSLPPQKTPFIRSRNGNCAAKSVEL
jgi:hypothetical protein